MNSMLLGFRRSVAVSWLSVTCLSLAFFSFPVRGQPQTIFVAQVVDGLVDFGFGGSYSTIFEIVNLSRHEGVEVTIQVFTESGAPWAVLDTLATIPHIPLSQRILRLEPLGSQALKTLSVGDVAEGWGRIDASGPVGVMATVEFQDSGQTGRTRFATASVLPDPPVAGFSFPARISTHRITGVALVNPGQEEVEATFSLYGRDGAAAGSASLTLPPGTKVAKLLNEVDLFPGLPQFEGTVEVTSTQPLAATVILVTDQAWAASRILPPR